MPDNTKKVEQICNQLKELPSEVASAALDQYAARMEGYAEGFAAGRAYINKI